MLINTQSSSTMKCCIYRSVLGRKTYEFFNVLIFALNHSVTLCILCKTLPVISIIILQYGKKVVCLYTAQNCYEGIPYCYIVECSNLNGLFSLQITDDFKTFTPQQSLLPNMLFTFGYILRPCQPPLCLLAGLFSWPVHYSNEKFF